MTQRRTAPAWRKRSWRTTMVLIALTVLGPASFERAAAQAQYQYTVTNVWPSRGLSDLAGFSVTGINAFGHVVGYFHDGCSYRGYRWQSGVMTDLGPPGPSCSSSIRASAINDSGQVVGQFNGRAFLWQNGVMTDLGTPGGVSSASGINDSGQVVGTFAPPGFAGGNGHAFLWQDGVTTDLGTLGGSDSVATGINASGQVVGYAFTASGVQHGFLWQNGVMTDLGTLGGLESAAYAINDFGQVVGYSYTPTEVCSRGEPGEYHAVLWDNGVIRDLQTFDCGDTIAYGINNAGQVVGDVIPCGWYGECPWSPFIYSDGVMTDLNDLITGLPDLGWWSMHGIYPRLHSATGINDAGQIVVNSTEGADRLDPLARCTTPDPFVALGGGTCWDGGWLPPGMVPPSSAPTPSPLPPPSGPAGCTTPDPFVALGGGTCYSGGWLPPGMAPPAGSPSPSPPVASPSPSVPAGCTTPDPFVSLGGGTCFSGGWLPPGMAPPTASPTPPAPPSGGCATPDPFVSIPGLMGVCVGGGWIPVIRGAP